MLMLVVTDVADTHTGTLWKAKRGKQFDLTGVENGSNCMIKVVREATSVWSAQTEICFSISRQSERGGVQIRFPSMSCSGVAHDQKSTVNQLSCSSQVFSLFLSPFRDSKIGWKTNGQVQVSSQDLRPSAILL